jgi:hypothetical protein
MPTIALTLPEYNDLLIRTALAAHQDVAERYGTPHPIVGYGVPSDGPSPAPENRGVVGRGIVTPGWLDRPLAEARRRLWKRGGRPRRHETSAARQRAYRTRQRARLAPGAGAR